MKNCFIILFFLFLPLCCIAQEDSTIAEILKSDCSTPELIAKCNELILEKIFYRDYEGAKRIKDFMISCVKDSEYVPFDEYMYPLVLYWIRDYEGLFEYFVDFDSLNKVIEKKIKPGFSEFQFSLVWSIPEEGERILDSIKKSDINSPQKKVLKLGLYRQMVDVDYGMSFRQLNFRTNKYIITHPWSEYNVYLKEKVRYNNRAAVGIGLEFTLGYGIFTKELNNYFRNNLGLTTAVDLYYNSVLFSLMINIAQSKTKQDIPYSSGTWTKGSRADTYIYQALLGYTVRTRYYKMFNITPFLGAGGGQIMPCSDDLKAYPDLKYAGLKHSSTFSAGFYFDLNLDYLILYKDFMKSDFSVRFSYYYSNMNFNNNYNGLKGGIHNISIGFGCFEKMYW